MDYSTEIFITLPITIFSIAISIVTGSMAIYLVHYFLTKNTIHRFFKYTASITAIFCALNSFFTTLYCLYFVLDPQFDDTSFYVYHPSHIQRITATVSWYTAKVSLIYVFTGRLYFTFKDSVFHVSKSLFISINTFNTIITPICLLSAYCAVYRQKLIMAEISFNIWRVSYQIVVFIVLCMYSKRLLYLYIQKDLKMNDIIMTSSNNSNTKNENENKEETEIEIPKMTQTESQPAPITTPSLNNIQSLSLPSINNGPSLNSLPSLSSAPSLSNDPSISKFNVTSLTKVPSKRKKTRKSSENPHEADNEYSFFLAFTARNGILTLTISCTVFLVTFSFLGFRFIFGPQTRITLLIPMITASFDSLITSFCVLCLFSCGKQFYYKICGKCDAKCKGLCQHIANIIYKH